MSPTKVMEDGLELQVLDVGELEPRHAAEPTLDQFTGLFWKLNFLTSYSKFVIRAIWLHPTPAGVE